MILDIDYNLTIKAFQHLGIENADTLYSKSSQIKLFDDLEKGLISEKEFFNSIRQTGNKNLSDNEIRDAWNSLLIGLPEENVRLLRELKKNYRLFLLSNTNAIHEKAYRQMIVDQYGTFIFDDLFEKIFLSHELHMRKPDSEIFDFVLADRHLRKNETLFIDDSPQHIDQANKTGIHTLLLKSITNLKSETDIVLSQ